MVLVQDGQSLGQQVDIVHFVGLALVLKNVDDSSYLLEGFLVAGAQGGLVWISN